MSIRAKFSRELYRYRKSHRLTQRAMSELCGVSLRHYQELEMGRALPSLINAVRIAATVNISLDSLKSEVDDMRYCYLPFEQVCYLEDLGYYRSFGICCREESAAGTSVVAQIADISTDKQLVWGLVDLYTQMQLRPVHLLDAVINAIP